MWLRLAAAQDNKHAQDALGREFIKHTVKPKDKAERKQWKKWATMKKP